MREFKKKPVTINAMTFNEMLDYMRSNGANIVEGMPWSYIFGKYSISHENDSCYLIETLEGTMKMTPEDMLIVGIEGEIYPCKITIFEKSYEEVK